MVALKEPISQASDPAVACASSTQPIGHFVTTERRRCPRHTASFAVGIMATQGRTLGLTQDISQSGALVLTPSHFSVGDRLRLELRLLQGQSPRLVDVQVVRTVPMGLRSNGLWRTRVAVQFEAPLDGMDSHFSAVAEKQTRLWQQEPSMSSNSS